MTPKLLIYLLCFGCLSLSNGCTDAQVPELPAGAPTVQHPFTKDQDKFSFAILGDKTGGGQDKWPIFDRAINEINELDPDFVIMTGDQIQGYTDNLSTLKQQWAEFREHQSRLRIPFLPAPGNHDISNSVMYDYWVKHIGLTYYAFTYKGCLFLLLNTEERQGGATGWFGEKQIAYVIETLEQQKDVRHTFLFMHKPAWLHSDSDWNAIEVALTAREYTVFAGHYHNLTLHTRHDHRYFVLGTIGGRLTPKDVKEFGAFNHYSIVTVDENDVNVAIIEPGNVHSANISTPEFTDNLRDIVMHHTDFEIDRSQPVFTGKIRLDLSNALAKVANIELAFNPNGSWTGTPNPIHVEMKPGWQVSGWLELSCPTNAMLPFPSFRYAVMYGGEQVYSRDVSINLIKPEHIHNVTEWMILGPFHLGTNQKPEGTAKPPDGSLPNFEAQLEPERDWSIDKSYQGINGEIGWQPCHAQGGVVDLNTTFNQPDWAIGYGLTHIKSPDNRTIFAGLRGDDLTRLIVNGVEIHTRLTYETQLTYINLPLKKGWNTILIKCADYTENWSYQLAIENSNQTLTLSPTPP